MKKHYQGVCQACRGKVRCTADGRAYTHFGKRWLQPRQIACLGSGRPTDNVTDGTVEAISATKGALL